MMRLPVWTLLALLALMPAARGQDGVRVPMRAGTHADLGRLVFDWPTRTGYTLDEGDGQVVIRFAAPARIDIAAVRRPPRNVLSVAQDGDAVTVRIAPGTRPRAFRLGNRIVLDIRDAPPEAIPRPAAMAPPPRAGRNRPITPDAAAGPTPASETPSRPATAPNAAGVAPAPPQPAPLQPAPPQSVPAARAPPAVPAHAPRPAAPIPATAPSRLRALPGGVAIALDAGAEAGIAVFRRGDWVHIVIDRPIAADPTVLRGHPVFAGLEVLSAGDGTAMRVPLPVPARLAVRRDGDTWVLEATRDPTADLPSLRALPDAGPPARLLLLGGHAGGSVAIADPATGETVLVGTLRQPGPGVSVARRLPEFDLLPTMMGAAILARSDRLALRVITEDRFALQSGSGDSLALGHPPGQEPPPAALAMSRLLDLPEGGTPALLERLRNLLLAVHAAPPLSRGPARRDTAETLLALGMPQEAQAMAAIAFQEDPQSRADPRLLLAHGAAALLAGRPGDALGIDDARLPMRDEVALWRALLATTRGDDVAPALRAAAPVVLTYPDALRARALPIVAEALAERGQVAGAAALLAAAGDVPGLDLARAMVMEGEGGGGGAIAAYDALVAGRDRRQRAVALRRLAELRLAAGTIDRPMAAETLEQSLFAWRGGADEVALRRRIATLRIESGQGQQAFALLDETTRLFPDQAAALRPAAQDAFAAALESAPPLAAATLFDARPDMLPDGVRGQDAVLVLAERLAGLDLPDRAASLLRRASDATSDRTARAAIGARLAALRVAEGDAAGALAALDASESEGIDAALTARRSVLRARAQHRRGARDEAEAALATLGPAGAATRADLRAEVQDWAGAAAAMADHVGAHLPPAPAPLRQEDRVSLARQAAFLALSGDDAGLAALRAAHGARMEGGALAEAFGVLTADPLRGIADLPRLQRDLGLLRLLPTRLEALRTGVQVAR